MKKLKRVIPLMLLTLSLPTWAAQKDVYNILETDMNGVPKKAEILPDRAWAGVQILGGSDKFMGSYTFVDENEAINTHGFGARIDLLPFRLGGHFGVGLEFGYHPAVVSKGETKAALKNAIGFGGRLHWQLQFWDQQAIIPVAGYSIKRYTFNSRAEGRSSGYAQSAQGGLWLALHNLDRKVATSTYQSSGLKKFYLTLEGDYVTSESDGIAYNVEDLAMTIGLRTEW